MVVSWDPRRSPRQAWPGKHGGNVHRTRTFATWILKSHMNTVLGFQPAEGPSCQGAPMTQRMGVQAWCQFWRQWTLDSWARGLSLSLWGCGQKWFTKTSTLKRSGWAGQGVSDRAGRRGAGPHWLFPCLRAAMRGVQIQPFYWIYWLSGW